MTTCERGPFVPGPATERAYRDALGTFATGVTVVTALSAKGPVGITVNSFASVSLDPPLVLWSLERDCDRFAAFDAAARTAIHVLGADQQELALHFARDGFDFDRIDWQDGADGVPLLPGCLSRFDCARSANHDGGDHRILVSRVLSVTPGEGTPLVFQAGAFGGFRARN